MSLAAKPPPEIRRLERRTRSIPLTNLSAEFILNSVSLAENSQYVSEYDRFLPLNEAKRHEDAILEIWKEALTERQRLLAAMELLRQKSCSKVSLKSEPDSQPCTWKQVIAEIQAANDTYRKTTFARMCDKSQIFEHWLNLLPNGDYTSTISGAFIMGVQAARGVSGIQRSIYEALASIPDTLSHAGAYLGIYKAHSSEALVQKTAALCKCILITLRLIIEFFLKSSFKRGAGAMLKGSAYQQELTESLLELKTQALSLREEANVCLQLRIAEMDRKSDLQASREQFRHELAKEELLLAIDSSTEITAQKVCTHLLRQLQSNPAFCIRTGGPCPPIENTLTITEEENSLSETSAAGNESVTTQLLLDILGYDDRLQRDDVDYCLTLGFTETQAFQDRASWVLQSPELGEFLAGEGESKFLLINGNYEATQFISSLSYVCAKIADLLSVSSQVFLLKYFCGRHTDEWREPYANAKGLMANVVGQLLSQIERREYNNFRLNLSSVTNEDCGAIQDGDLAATYAVFRAVVKQLPKGTVIFCLIDGISAYENSDRVEDTTRLLQKLIRLMRKSRRVVFKCMVTYPGRSNYSDTWGLDFDGKESVALHVPEGQGC